MMRSCLLASPSETELDVRCLPLASLLEDDYFATVPMIVISREQASQRESEEELYTSFEQAISERVARISRRLSALPLAGSRTSGALSVAPLSVRPRSRFVWREWRRAITLCCLALSLFIAGFDLLGLLLLAR
ncbi:MAG TPA: hypothetical protein VFV38_04535 [Ktedonobacteraceae bacterium]|nr:hypothetical protein [Ktedonobacteraceae bacterium]